MNQNPNTDSSQEMEKFKQEQKDFNKERLLNLANKPDLKKVETLEILDI